MKPIRILVISDDKPGHKNQSLGLINALSRILPVQTTVIAPLSKHQLLRELFKTHEKQAFQLIIGTGHQTHVSLILLGYFYRAKTILLMRPSLPYCLFNACIIPRHDQPPLCKNILITDGAINQIQGPFEKQNQTLILLGGESKHFIWDNQKVLTQIETICQNTDHDKTILLTNSRRTPNDLAKAIAQSRLSNRLHIYDHTNTPPNWLVEQLKKSNEVYVTPDSISMIYEALTAQCKVRLFNLIPKNKKNKVVHAIEDLKDKKHVLNYDDQKTEINPLSLNEAQRTAHWIVDHFSLMTNIDINK